MKKRTLSLMLAAAMVRGSLTGCGTGRRKIAKKQRLLRRQPRLEKMRPLQRHRKLGHRQKMGEKGICICIQDSSGPHIPSDV